MKAVVFNRNGITHNNTVVDVTEFGDSTQIQVRPYNTNIVTATYRKGDKKLSITLYTGGFYTHTTKKRMNEVLAALGTQCEVRQIDYGWYVVCDNIMVPFWEHYACVVIK